MLGKLNDDYDTQLLDRTMELHEALGELKKHPGIIISSFTDQDYMMNGFQEYLEEQGQQIAALL